MKKILCFGDSNTYGYDPAGMRDGTAVRYAHDVRWCGVAQRDLGEGWHVIEEGLNGRTTVRDDMCHLDTNLNGIRALPMLLEAHKPLDAIVIMLGTNDSKQKYWDAERYEEQYLALIDELHNLPGHPYLYLMAPPEAFPAEEGEILYGINNDVIGGEIRNLVPDIAEQSGCGTLDLYALTQDHPEYFVDGIHPTEEGYALIAQMVADQIRADRNAGVW